MRIERKLVEDGTWIIKYTGVETIEEE